MIKLAVFDIDGTLVVKGNRTLFDTTVKALQNLQKQGIKLAIASGRPPFFMEKRLVEQISFDYYICSNGTCIMDKDFKRIWQADICAETVDIITELLEKTQSGGSFVYTDNVYAYRNLPLVKQRMYEFVGTIDHLVDHTSEQNRHYEDLPFAGLAYIKEEKVHLFDEVAPELLFEKFSEDCFDVYPRGINKGTGVLQICERLNIDPKYTIGFGDDINDIEMLKICGTSVVMGSSSDEVKSYADFVTKSASEDGVVYALKQLRLLQEE